MLPGPVMRAYDPIPPFSAIFPEPLERISGAAAVSRPPLRDRCLHFFHLSLPIVFPYFGSDWAFSTSD